MSGETKQRLSDLEAENATLRKIIANQQPTLRDLFAMSALTGLVADKRQYSDRIAEEAYMFADAMLRER